MRRGRDSKVEPLGSSSRGYHIGVGCKPSHKHNSILATPTLSKQCHTRHKMQSNRPRRFCFLCCGVGLHTDTSTKQNRRLIQVVCSASFLCGEKGIRTPETLLTFTRFPGGPVQPLLHLSLLFCVTNIELISEIHNSTSHEQPTLQFNLQFFIQLLLILEDYTYICAILIQCADL